MLNELKNAKKVVGIKQLRKAVANHLVSAVYLAGNADPALTQPVALLCGETGIPVIWVETMSELGSACGISVGASAAGILQ